MLLREVTNKDIKQLFEWANDDAVRKNAVNQGKIAWEDHNKWYNSRVFGSKTYIYVLEDNSESIGQIRFDKIENNYEIDYSIDEKYRGKGYGITILKEGIDKLFRDLKKKRFNNSQSKTRKYSLFQSV